MLTPHADQKFSLIVNLTTNEKNLYHFRHRSQPHVNRFLSPNGRSCAVFFTILFLQTDQYIEKAPVRPSLSGAFRSQPNAVRTRTCLPDASSGWKNAIVCGQPQRGKKIRTSVRLRTLDSDDVAPQVGLEPTTLRLTAECSAIELLRNTGLLSLRTGLLYSGQSALSTPVLKKV